jgi:hypothetical protein
MDFIGKWNNNPFLLRNRSFLVDFVLALGKERILWAGQPK